MIGGLLALALLAQPAGEAEPDYAIPDLTVADGDRWTITVERSIEESRGGAVKRWTGEASYVAELDRTMNRGNVVTWTPVTAKLQPHPPHETAILAAQAPIVFRADSSLTPRRIENWEALKAAMTKASPEAAAFAQAGPDAAGRFLLREAELLSVLQDMPLERGKPFEVDDNPPNPLGGAAIPGKLRFEPAETSAGLVRVRSSRTLTPEALAPVINQLKAAAAKLGPEQKRQADVQITGLSLQRRDDCTYEMDAETGQTRTAACVSVVRTADGASVRTERVRVTQTPVD